MSIFGVRTNATHGASLVNKFKHNATYRVQGAVNLTSPSQTQIIINLRNIQLNTGVHVTPGQTLVSSIKKKVFQEVPVGEEWKVPLIRSLLGIRSGELKLEFEEDDIADNEIVDDVLLNVCTS